MTVAIWNYMNSSWIGFDDVRVIAVSMKKYYNAGGQRVDMYNGRPGGARVALQQLLYPPLEQIHSTIPECLRLC